VVLVCIAVYSFGITFEGVGVGWRGGFLEWLTIKLIGCVWRSLIIEDDISLGGTPSPPITATCMSLDMVAEVAPFSPEETEGEDATVAAVRPSGGSAQRPAGDGILERHL
jgi:hypothetical protein